MRKIMLGAVLTTMLWPAEAGAKSWTVTSTSYCLHGKMADGTKTRKRSVANNFLPLGTKITARPGFYGRIWFVVRDHIGYGTQLDFWHDSCAAAIRYGRRAQTITQGWHHNHSKKWKRRHKHHHHGKHPRSLRD